MLNLLLSVVRKIVTDPELYRKEQELEVMRGRARELHSWCAGEFPEVGSAAKWMLNVHDAPHASGVFGDISCFREALRAGTCDRAFATKSPTKTSHVEISTNKKDQK